MGGNSNGALPELSGEPADTVAAKPGVRALAAAAAWGPAQSEPPTSAPAQIVQATRVRELPNHSSAKASGDGDSPCEPAFEAIDVRSFRL
jgi:hypothetical protein